MDFIRTNSKDDPTDNSDRKKFKRIQEKIFEYNIKDRNGVDFTRIK